MDWCVCLQRDIRSVSEVTRQSRVLLRRFVLVWCPYVNIIRVTLRRQKLSIHRWWSYNSDLSWVADYLLYFYIWVFFRRIIIENWLKLWNQIMVLFGNLYVCEYDIIGVISPCAISWIVDAVCLTWEVNSLIDYFWVLINKWAPLYRCGRPV